MKHRHSSNQQAELFWPRVVVRKWLNITAQESDYSADSDDDSCNTECDTEEFCEWPRELRFKDKKGDELRIDPNESLPRSRRRKSETFRAQYIDTKELKISVSTWNVGGIPPPDDLDIDDWLDIGEPSDIYVIGFQEIIPLNAGNIFGAEDRSPIPKWESIIRSTLNKSKPLKTKFKCYSNPSSPSRFKPYDVAPDLADEILLETDSGGETEIYPMNEMSDGFDNIANAEASVSNHVTNLARPAELDLNRQFSLNDRFNILRTEGYEGNEEESIPLLRSKLTKTLSGQERIGLSWPEPPVDLLAQCVLERPNTLRSFKSFKASKSFRNSSFKSYTTADGRIQSEAPLLENDMESLVNRKRRSPYVRIVSKQMVGIFVTIWVRRSLRRHIQNVNVSTVGVGVMGYIGNKGSISVSMSIYQTFFCFICSHLTSGEKDVDAIKRNADVHEICRRTRFNSMSSFKLPKSIRDHDSVELRLGWGSCTTTAVDVSWGWGNGDEGESSIEGRIIWLGDLNYRINLSYEKTRELISKKNWPKLVESDQLVRELRKGCAFDGWSEGTLNFPPTYKFELNSEKYVGEDPKVGRRTPAWCDRVLSMGKGLRLLSYRRSEFLLSDHRPVTALFMVEVEEFCPRKLQKALTFTDAEIEDEEIGGGISSLRLGELMKDALHWEN
ncbi:hypothetical protein LguiB_017616 [Lonicera macranthoides]